ncbi:MAG: bacterioferritin [Pirellulales bacterium]|nr:bacterioferritin [Pirellulales bacterium]
MSASKTKSIELLNKGVAEELATIHQYMYWHFHLDDQGFTPLAGMLRRIAIVEMAHLERLSERILFLKGDVEMVPSAEVKKITDPEEILKSAAEMENAAVEMYNDYANRCAANSDSVSKQLFESLVTDEEAHYDEFDKQLDNIKRFGPSYLALQSFANSSSAPAE